MTVSSGKTIREWIEGTLLEAQQRESGLSTPLGEDIKRICDDIEASRASPPEGRQDGGVAVKALDESKTQGWSDDKGRFYLPLSDGYYIKFPKDDDGLYGAWFYSDPIGVYSKRRDAIKAAQKHHETRILSALAHSTPVEAPKCQHTNEWLETFATVTEGRLTDELAEVLGIKQYPEFASSTFGELLEIVRHRLATNPTQPDTRDEVGKP